MTRRDELFIALEELTLDEAARRELLALLADPENRAALVAHLHTGAVVADFFAERRQSDANVAPATAKRAHRFWSPRTWALAASLAIVLSVTIVLLSMLGKASGPVLARIEGQVRVDSMPAQVGMSLRSGARVESVDPGSSVMLEFADHSWVQLDGATSITITSTDNGPGIHLDCGGLSGEFQKQEPGRPFVFTTPQARATVLGTRLRLTDDGQRSRLAVEKGAVRLEIADGDKATEVRTGHFADASPGRAPVSRPFQDMGFEDIPAAEPEDASAAALDPTQTLDLGNGVNLQLALVPAGQFVMGTSEINDLTDQKPAHTATITRPFYIGVHEVTQEQYEQITGNNPSRFRHSSRKPVEQVSWSDAIDFCRRLSARTGKKVRLPTEAQWEYACRARTATRYGFGDDNEELYDFAWGPGNTLGNNTHPVGELKPNAWGLYDMHGNVSEWCADWFAPYGSEPVVDPQGPCTGTSRVNRGGSFHGAVAESARRSGAVPETAKSIIGFRVVVNVD